MFAKLPAKALSLILQRLLPPSPLPVTIRSLASQQDLFALLLAYPTLRDHLPHPPFHPLHTVNLLHPASLTQGPSSFDAPHPLQYLHAIPLIFANHLLSLSLPPHLPASSLLPLLRNLSLHCPNLSDLTIHDTSFPNASLISLFPSLVFLHVLQPSPHFLHSLTEPHDTLHTLSLHHLPPEHLPVLHPLLSARFSTECTSAFGTLSNLLLTIDLPEQQQEHSPKSLSKFFRLLSLLPSTSPTSKFCSFSIAFHSPLPATAQHYDALFREQVFTPSQAIPLANLLESSAPPRTVHYLHYPGSVIDFQLPYLLSIQQLLQPPSADPVVSLQTTQASVLYFDVNSFIASRAGDEHQGDTNDDNLLDDILDRCQSVPHLCIGWTPREGAKKPTDMTTSFEFIDLICQLVHSLPGLHTLEFEQDVLSSSIPLAAITDHPTAFQSITHILFSRTPHPEVMDASSDLLEAVRQLAMLVRTFLVICPRVQVLHMEARFFEGLTINSSMDRSDVADAFNAVLELQEHLSYVDVHTLLYQLRQVLEEHQQTTSTASSSSAMMIMPLPASHSPTSIK